MLKLERAIRDKGWSLSEAGRQSRVNQVTIGQIVSGRLQPYPVQLKKLAAALGFVGDPAELLREVSAGDD